MVTLPTIYPGEVYLQNGRSHSRIRGEVELPRWPPSLNGPSPRKVDTARSARPHQLGYSSTSLQMNSTEKRSRHLAINRIITEALGPVLGSFLHDGPPAPIARLCAMKRRASGLLPNMLFQQDAIFHKWDTSGFTYRFRLLKVEERGKETTYGALHFSWSAPCWL